jgi:hypothetical protein
MPNLKPCSPATAGGKFIKTPVQYRQGFVGTLLLRNDLRQPANRSSSLGSGVSPLLFSLVTWLMAHSGSNEVLVSLVVTDLAADADLKFAERGSFELKGLPGRWDSFAAST